MLIYIVRLICYANWFVTDDRTSREVMSKMRADYATYWEDMARMRADISTSQDNIAKITAATCMLERDM